MKLLNITELARELKITRQEAWKKVEDMGLVYNKWMMMYPTEKALQDNLAVMGDKHIMFTEKLLTELKGA